MPDPERNGKVLMRACGKVCRARSRAARARVHLRSIGALNLDIGGTDDKAARWLGSGRNRICARSRFPREERTS